MQPRLPNSQKWTPFPKEYLEQVRSVMEESFKKYLEKGQFIIDGRIYREEIVLRLGFLEKGRLKQSNFEASMQYSYEQDNALQSLSVCLDCCASLLWEFLEKMHSESAIPNSDPSAEDFIEVSLEDELNLPYTWTQIEFDDKKLHIQYTTTNTSLESAADALLGEEFTNSLFNEDFLENNLEISPDSPNPLDFTEEPLNDSLANTAQGFDSTKNTDPALSKTKSVEDINTDNLKAPYRDGRDLLH